MRTADSSKLFGSRVARRIFVLIALAGLLPLIVAAGYSHYETSRVLRKASFTQLREDAKAFGMEILANLQATSASAQLLADTRDGTALVDGALAGREFAGAWHTSYQGRVLGPSPVSAIAVPPTKIDREHLGRGRPQLVEVAGDDGRAFVLLMTNSRSGPGELLAFRLHGENLWQPRAYVAFGSEYCVFSAGYEPLHCTEPMSDEELSHVATAAGLPTSEPFEWRRDGVAKLSAAWTLFLAPELGYDTVRVVSTADRERLLGAGDVSLDVLPPLFAFVVVLVGFLSLRLIRRSLTPLRTLIDSTRDFAAGRLERRVAVDGGDEFSELGSAFNSMASSLSDKLLTLQTMSAVDGLIMSQANRDDIVEEFLKQAIRVSRVRTVAACIPDADNPLNASLYVYEVNRLDVCRVSPVHLSRFPDADDGGNFALHPVESAPRSVADRLEARGIHFAVTARILVRDLVKGVILFCADDQAALDPERIRQCDNLIGRLAVGISGAEREEDLYRQAHYDELTGLPNRQLLKDRLAQAATRADKSGRHGAILFMDLDRFKQVNDVFGHSTGDEVLRESAQRICAACGEETTVARLGGDEFVVILEDTADVAEVGKTAANVVAVLSRAFTIDGSAHILGASVGIAQFPHDGDNVEILLRNADAAMYRAKDSGRGRYEFFSQQLSDDSHRRLMLERDLREAFETGQLDIHFQPQYDLDTRQMRGAELLLRWRHPTLGMVSPVEFIEIAEESDLIVSIGRWLIAEACRIQREWIDEGVLPVVLAINISARHLGDSDLLGHLYEALERYRIEPHLIELEVTESIVARNKERALATLGAIRDAGIRIAMDDFGTGYSSLAYLQHLPFDIIKIDKSFVIEIGHSDDAESICRMIITMAHELGKQVIAEGVETGAQARFLARHHCEVGQGYHLARPMTRDQFHELILETGTRRHRRLVLEAS